MQFKQTLVRLFFLLTPFTVFSQVTTYLPQGAKENVLLERLEIKRQTDSILNFSKTTPFSRKEIVRGVQHYGNLYNNDSVVMTLFKSVDAANKNMLLRNNIEYRR